MNIRQAVRYLEEYEVTSSEQALSSWSRQGTSKATMRSKKEAYQVSRGSLQYLIRTRLGLSSLDEWEDKSEEYEKRIKELESENARLRVKYNKAAKDLHKKRLDEFLWSRNGAQHKNIFGTEDETKEVFKHLFHHIHPDKGGDPVLFSKVNKAYRNIFRDK